MTDAAAQTLTDTSLAPTASSTWDLAPVAHYLTASTDSDAETAWAAAELELKKEFPPDTWGMDHTVNQWGPNAHRNLFTQEAPGDFRTMLAARRVTADDYERAVGPIQYVSAEIRLLSLLRHGASNKGWRLRIVGFPSIQVVAMGLCSHYQGTQNQNAMGHASSLIRTRALEVLAGDNRRALEGWPSATSEHWDNRGLMSRPALQIGHIDISWYDNGAGAKLRMVRNTTAKKELSTFFAIKGLPADKFDIDGDADLAVLKAIALELGSAEAS